MKSKAILIMLLTMSAWTLGWAQSKQRSNRSPVIQPPPEGGSAVALSQYCGQNRQPYGAALLSPSDSHRQVVPRAPNTRTLPKQSQF